MEDNNLDSKKMDKNRKTAIIVLSVFSALIIVMSFFNFRQNLHGPLAFGGEDISSNNSSNSSKCADGNCSVGDLDSSNLELKLLDTDSDKISDWDELFIYSTSPYLEDTDGDGLSDYEEIFTYKTNPNCPEGQVCTGTVVSAELDDVSGTSTEDLSTIMDDWSTYYDSELGADKLPSDLQPEAVSAQYVREILLDNGFTQENLDKISDEELLKLYQEVLADF